LNCFGDFFRRFIWIINFDSLHLWRSLYYYIMKRLIVGMPESCSPDDVSVMRSYVDAVRRGGHFPIVLPATSDREEALTQLAKIDILLLLGGGDIEACRFGCVALPTDGTPNLLRDQHELLLFELACQQRKPVVGICRGMQIINIGLGGDLCQDLPTQWDVQTVNHSRPDSKWHPVHSITISEGSRLAEVLEETAVSVNSTHHQAVGRLGSGIRATAWAEDGVVEAIESDELPVAAVQFHPERLAWGEDICFTKLFAKLTEFAGSFRILLLCLLWGLSSSLTAQQIMPPDFVRLSEAAPDIMQEIRYYSTYNFVGERIPGYEAPEAILVKPAADSLIAVNRELMTMGYRLKVMDAYRPQRAVDFFVRWAMDQSDERMKPYFYPDCPKNELFHRGYLSRRSGHTRGATVDVTLFDMRLGREVDMGTPYDLLGLPSHFAYTEGLSQQQLEMRRLLRSVMCKHGFKPIACEWWHFTLVNEPYPVSSFNFPVQ